MKQMLKSIVKNECKYLTPEFIRRKQVILIKLNVDGSIDQHHLSEAFVSVNGKQGPGLGYVVTLDQLREEVNRGIAGNPARRYFIERSASNIFEVKAFGDHRQNLVIFADDTEESQHA